MSNMAKVHAELHPSVQERLEKVQNVQKSDEVVESSGPKTLTLQEFRQAILLHRKETNYPLLTAFNDIKFIIPGKTVDVPNPRLAKRREYLKLREEERNYNKMVYGSASNPQADEVLQAGNQFNSLKTQMSISFNLLFSLFGTFGLVYFMTKQFGYDSSQSLMYGLFASIAVLVLEMTLFILRAVRIEAATEKKPSYETEQLANLRGSGLVVDIALSSSVGSKQEKEKES